MKSKGKLVAIIILVFILNIKINMVTIKATNYMVDSCIVTNMTSELETDILVGKFDSILIQDMKSNSMVEVKPIAS